MADGQFNNPEQLTISNLYDYLVSLFATGNQHRVALICGGHHRESFMTQIVDAFVYLHDELSSSLVGGFGFSFKPQRALRQMLMNRIGTDQHISRKNVYVRNMTSAAKLSTSDKRMIIGIAMSSPAQSTLNKFGTHVYYDPRSSDKWSPLTNAVIHAPDEPSSPVLLPWGSDEYDVSEESMSGISPPPSIKESIEDSSDDSLFAPLARIYDQVRSCDIAQFDQPFSTSEQVPRLTSLTPDERDEVSLEFLDDGRVSETQHHLVADANEKTDTIPSDAQTMSMFYSKCPICLEIPLPPWYTMSCGHLICEPCFNDATPALTKCPTCRKDITRTLIPQYMMNQLAQDNHIKLPCRHVGCGKHISWDRAGEHNNSCPFRPLRCPYGEGCSYIDDNTESMISHFSQRHNIKQRPLENMELLGVTNWHGILTRGDIRVYMRIRTITEEGNCFTTAIVYLLLTPQLRAYLRIRAVVDNGRDNILEMVEVLHGRGREGFVNGFFRSSNQSLNLRFAIIPSPERVPFQTWFGPPPPPLVAPSVLVSHPSTTTTLPVTSTVDSTMEVGVKRKHVADDELDEKRGKEDESSLQADGTQNPPRKRRRKGKQDDISE